MLIISRSMRHCVVKVVFAVFLICSVIIIIKYIPPKLKPKLNQIKLNHHVKCLNPMKDNISCYYDYESDVLPSVDRQFRPSPRSIFFHETSCKGGLDARQACAVEAAARAHPHWQIHVLFAAPVHNYQGPMKTLLLFSNINFARFHIKEYTKETPLESFISSGILNRSCWIFSHSSDVLRYTTLYKFGGIYLDLDAIVVKPLTGLRKSWVARESDKTVASSALAFSRNELGRTVAEKAVRDIATNFRGDIWGYNGPGVITRVLKAMCATDDVAKMTAAKCAGFEVYDSESFNPIKWQNASYYFDPGVLNNSEAYIYHVWNKVTHNTPVRNDSRYANLAKRYCPTVHKDHPEDFGDKPL